MSIITTNICKIKQIFDLWLYDWFFLTQIPEPFVPIIYRGTQIL